MADISKFYLSPLARDKILLQMPMDMKKNWRYQRLISYKSKKNQTIQRPKEKKGKRQTMIYKIKKRNWVTSTQLKSGVKSGASEIYRQCLLYFFFFFFYFSFFFCICIFFFNYRLGRFYDDCSIMNCGNVCDKIRIEINHGSQIVFWVLTWVGGYKLILSLASDTG